MLTLKRKVGQQVMLRLEDGREIAVMVTDAGVGWAKVGITAPRSINVYREELAVREQTEAA